MAYEGDKVSLGRFLKSHHGGRLKSEVGLEVLSDLTDQSLEREFPDEQLRRPVSRQRQSSVTEVMRTDFWYRRISRSATVPGRYRWGFFTPPVVGADFRAALVATAHCRRCAQILKVNSRCLRGALPPVDLRAVCLVRAIVIGLCVEGLVVGCSESDDEANEGT